MSIPESNQYVKSSQLVREQHREKERLKLCKSEYDRLLQKFRENESLPFAFIYHDFGKCPQYNEYKNKGYTIVENKIYDYGGYVIRSEMMLDKK
jgi:hypothetical protein